MTEVPEDDLRAAVDRAQELARRLAGVDGWEVRADLRDDRRFARRDGEASGARVTRSRGLGVRVFAGNGSAYVHTADLSTDAIRAALERGVQLARASGRHEWRAFPLAKAPARRATYEPQVKDAPVAATSQDQVMDLLARAEQGAKEAAPGANVQTGFGAHTMRVVLADSWGSWVERGSLVSTLIVTVAARDAGRLGSGIARRAGERGLGDYEDAGGPEALGAEGAKRAHDSLRAEQLPAGRYRVLCDPELSGTLAHESFGHLTEFDLVSSGWSKLQGRRGERLAVEGVSVSDAPIIPGRQGVAVPIDDEGVAGKATTLLEDGVLARWMHTRDSAAAEGDAPAGNARALNARFPPIVRMRNTYFEPGDHSLDEAFEALGDGLYLLGAHGGAPHSDGSFMFTSARGFRVENGRITTPVRTTAIHGNVLSFLRDVELLTRDFEVTTNYYGGCGKRDQSFLHVGVGGPHVLVNGALVGGSVR